MVNYNIKNNDNIHKKQYEHFAKNMYCSNCGKNGHIFKNCKDPIISYGLICFYNKDNITKNINNYRKTRKHIHNFNNISTLKHHKDYGKCTINPENEIKIEEIIDMDDDYKDDDNIQDNGEKIILVQRRYTIGLIEFLHGKYNINDTDYIIKLFNMMTNNEKLLLRNNNNFDTIRSIIGLRRDYIYKQEYEDAKQKFNTLNTNTNDNTINKLLDKSIIDWEYPEWGLPKGRRNFREYDIECAIREFVEETGIKYKNINVYRNIKPLEEIYKGINGITYKHIYYFATIKDTTEAKQNMEIIEKNNIYNYEISNVKLFNINECNKLIRPYYTNKINIINKGFQIINNMEYYFETN